MAQVPAVGDLGLDVLTNGLIFAHLWGMLDRDDKKSLRRVCHDVRELVDAAVDLLDTHSKGGVGALAVALAWKWPHVSSLTADCDDTSSTVLRFAPLTRLRSLTLYAVRHARTRMAPPSRNAHAACHACMQRAGAGTRAHVPRVCTTRHTSTEAAAHAMHHARTPTSRHQASPCHALRLARIWQPSDNPQMCPVRGAGSSRR
jgi:hypothetical protein